MKCSTMNKRNTASKQGDDRKVGIKNPLKIMVASALLLAATNAVAGIIFVSVGGNYINPELAPVSIQDNGSGSAVVRTTGLVGELSLDASDVPPKFDPPASGCKRFPFDQELELVINLSLGVVEGHTSGSIATENGLLEYRADVRGNATCVPAGGSDCGQVIVDLETRGAFVDASDPMLPGLIRMETLGSLLRGPDGARWTSLSSNARLGGDAGLISSITSMGEGESCGI